ncbi:I78 family peptidase inhibitor [Altererythrobacter sp. MF3-039]|uniref:I78 family peptidase inhibitor n=1 Tax=Altererythrobacter sp. MF3-039 TaxID=3252901 RepID=UPI00390C86DC
MTYAADAAPDEPERRPVGDGATCDASALQDHIGHTASQQSGAILLELSGARSLRWGPPDSAWTMDYRQDRLNVRYDRDMKITAITCG